MATFLFDEIIFGPIFSRRLGISLGINVLPAAQKLCNFNCIYCECGWTKADAGKLGHLPSRMEVRQALEAKLSQMAMQEEELDVITFAGNGEPTLHPDFPGIVDDTIELRDKYFPGKRIAVLSNATNISNPLISEALMKVDDNILKLDAGTIDKIKLINHPQAEFDFGKLIDGLGQFGHNLVIQSLFLKGHFESKDVDNTTEEDIVAWLKIIERIIPLRVMIYTFARSTPSSGLIKLSYVELQQIADRVRHLGIEVQVSG
ncbi:MAG: radical SAM protein [Bacteroidia bacterium]|nr:radical SAM protein [Bacteroidia bacterium]